MEINEDILIRYIDGMLTEEEAAEVKNWRAASLENEKLLEQVYFTTQVASRLKVMRTVNPDEALSRFKSRIHKKEKRLALRQVLGVIQRAAAVLFIPVFLLSAYKDESMIETTLVEGSVKLNVVSGGKRMTQMLKPNEKAEYQKGADKIKVFDVNTEYDTAWKNGEIIFRNHPMDKVLKTLERHYHVVFEVKDNEILKSIITARFKDEQLPQVLEYLKLASGIQYAIHKPTVKDSGSGTSVVEISK